MYTIGLFYFRSLSPLILAPNITTENEEIGENQRRATSLSMAKKTCQGKALLALKIEAAEPWHGSYDGWV